MKARLYLALFLHWFGSKLQQWGSPKEIRAVINLTNKAERRYLRRLFERRSKQQ